LSFTTQSKIGYLDYIKFGTNSFPVLIPEKDIKGNRTVACVERSEANLEVPVYIGVGLRLKANILVKKGSVDLGSLFAIGIVLEQSKFQEHWSSKPWG
jgi:hypothetical protein